MLQIFFLCEQVASGGKGRVHVTDAFFQQQQQQLYYDPGQPKPPNTPSPTPVDPPPVLPVAPVMVTAADMHPHAHELAHPHAPVSIDPRSLSAMGSRPSLTDSLSSVGSVGGPPNPEVFYEPTLPSSPRT